MVWTWEMFVGGQWVDRSTHEYDTLWQAKHMAERAYRIRQIDQDASYKEVA